MKNSRSIKTIVTHAFFKAGIYLLVDQEFYIGNNHVREFIQFYVTAKHFEDRDMNTGKSLKQISDEKIIQYQIDELDKDSYYEQIQHLYSVINEKNKIKYEKNREEFKKASKNEKQKRLGNRYKGVNIKVKNRLEFDSLHKVYSFKRIDENNRILKNANTTYKRIREMNSHNIKYKNLKLYIQLLREDIDKSDLEYKSIQYYKLEKRLTYEIIKTICAAYSKLDKADLTPSRKKVFFIYSLLVAQLPLIDMRHKYLELYLELYRDSYYDSIRSFIGEIEGLTRLIKYTVTAVLFEVDKLKREGIEVEYDLGILSRMYVDDYKSKYEIGKDFSAIDFKEVMRGLRYIQLNVKDME